MPLSAIPITILPYKSESKKEPFVILSTQLVNQLKLENPNSLTLAIGKTVLSTKIMTMEVAANNLYISEQILEALCLPIRDYTCHAVYRPEMAALWLGPVIGLVTDQTIEDGEKPNFRSIHKFCEELHQGIKTNGGFFYVFSYRHFPEQGFYYEAGDWKRVKPPIPDVIYNRIHSRKQEFTDSFNSFRNLLEKLRIPMFNDRFLSKWEVNNWLHEELQLTAHIPETKLFTKENFFELAQKFETVFVKPIHGSQGRNIIKAIRSDDSQYMIQTSFSHPLIKDEERFSLHEAFQKIKSMLNKQVFLIQQGIPFLTYESRPLDFRVLCHKSDQYHWKVTSVIARVGAADEFVSNLARGGMMMRPVEALSHNLDSKRSLKVLEQLKFFSLEAASAISRHASGITGELGIDIGIDETGKPWLIEVNSKPSKKFEDDPGSIRPSAKAIIQFCIVLALDFMTEREIG